MTVSSITDTLTCLTFNLDEEVFAVDVSNVLEVLDLTEITRVPRTPDFMKGVINLRGSVIPVVDMRRKFLMPEAEKTPDTCIIVMEVSLDGERTLIGAIADSVKEVFNLDPEQIEPPPRIGTRLKTEFILGMGKKDDDFIMILDISKVFSADELNLVQEAGGGQPVETEKPPEKKRKKKKSGDKTGHAGEEESGKGKPGQRDDS